MADLDGTIVVPVETLEVRRSGPDFDVGEAAMAGYLVLYGAWQGTFGGLTRTEAEVILDCYERTLLQKQAAWDGLRSDAEVQQLRQDHQDCRETLILVIQEPARVLFPLGVAAAQNLMRSFETAARGAERTQFDSDQFTHTKNPDTGEFEHEFAADSYQTQCDSLRHDIVQILSETVDYRDLYLRSESEAEGLACELSSLKSAVREAGSGIEDAHDLRCLLDTLRGEVLAADHKRDELAAFVVTLMDHLKSFRTNDMNSGLEMQHHAVIASPRSAESEKISHGLLHDRVDKVYGQLLSVKDRRIAELEAKLAETQRAEMDLNRRIVDQRDTYAEFIQDADIRSQDLQDRLNWTRRISACIMPTLVLVLIITWLMQYFFNT